MCPQPFWKIDQRDFFQILHDESSICVLDARHLISWNYSTLLNGRSKTWPKSHFDYDQNIYKSNCKIDIIARGPTKRCLVTSFNMVNMHATFGKASMNSSWDITQSGNHTGRTDGRLDGRPDAGWPPTPIAHRSFGPDELKMIWHEGPKPLIS